MSKKLSSLEDLAKIQFENLAPDPEGYVALEDQFVPQQLEAHFSNKEKTKRSKRGRRRFHNSKNKRKFNRKNKRNKGRQSK